MPQADQHHLPHIPCVILSGGQSRRFGSDKALALYEGERLIDRMLRLLEAQTSGPVAVNTSRDYGLNNRVILADKTEGAVGPLAGIHAAIWWAQEQGFNAVVTVPVDTPLVPATFIADLQANGLPSVAVCEGQLHPTHGYWPVSARPALKEALQSGMRAARAWAEAVQAKPCVFRRAQGTDPFFNVNRQDDLKRLQQSRAP